MMERSRITAIVCFLAFVAASEDFDFYESLGVSREASVDQIKKSYRKLSVQFHPDKNPGDAAAAEKFMRISRAYEVLSDPEKRSIYDMQGIQALKEHEGQAAGGGGGGMNPFDFLYPPPSIAYALTHPPVSAVAAAAAAAARGAVRTRLRRSA
jgi:curved DNA-binding protein CbpA